MISGSLQGRLLVANPRMVDPNFDRTIVLMLAHGDEGALGVVLNRPGETPVRDMLPGWENVATPPLLVFAGGPVDPASVLCLVHRRNGELGTFDMEEGPEAAGLAAERLRLFAGYAGWGAGQLEGELEAGGWFVVDAQAADAFSPEPESLWRSVLRRQRSTLALVASYPRDPTMN